jgi:hypothetical protein
VLCHQWQYQKNVASKLRFPHGKEFLRELSVFWALDLTIFASHVQSRKTKASRLEGVPNYLGACTQTGFMPESDPAPVVEFFTRTGIAAAGGQFDFERCTRKMFVHRNRKHNLLVLLYPRRKYKKHERQYWIQIQNYNFGTLKLTLSMCHTD